MPGASDALGGPVSVAKAGVGLATGALQALQAMKLKKQANAAFPDQVDPNQASYLADLNQKRKSIETGADFSEGMRAADTTNAATNDSIVKNSGGDIGAAMQGLLQSEAVAGQSKNNILAQGQSQQFNYDNAYGQMLNQISARKMQFQLLRSQQLRSQWDAKSKASSANIQAGIGSILPGALSSGGNSTGSAPSPASQNPLSSMLGGSPTDTGVASAPDAAPSVVPKQNLATGSLGPLMNLLPMAAAL